ncbi:fasciclin domain-containing protein [Cumulibacter manganitolerans]|uniref:fasciclin domain-containing protein n=1 Tax=Cumulibacter manganitolerans TaxID=1884992 RepID=UPI001295C571|nr:fasciclin domain-containing protein [Cumulibacter manganitolerans]
MRKTFRAGAAAALIAFPLMMAGCSSDTNDPATSSSGGSSMSEPMSDTGSASGSGSSASMSDPSASAMAQPFGPGCAAVPKDGAGSFDGMAKDPVATAASNNPALSTLVAAVKQANLVDTLNSAKDITVFAPTNDAFAAVPKQTLDAAMADPSGLLTKVLTNHVVQGKLTPDQLAGEHTTLGGGKITVTGSGTDFMVGQAKVVCGNVTTANATVYIIDQVLLPA